MNWKGADCANCPFSKNGRPQHTPVPAEYPYKHPPVGVLVGESPGFDEVASGRPFTGATGMELDRALEDERLFRGNLLVINAIGCRPTSKRDVEMRKACLCCRPAFHEQVKRIVTTAPDTPTMALGKWAVFQLTDRIKHVAEAHGFPEETWTWRNLAPCPTPKKSGSRSSKSSQKPKGVGGSPRR